MAALNGEPTHRNVTSKTLKQLVKRDAVCLSILRQLQKRGIQTVATDESEEVGEEVASAHSMLTLLT